jgi:hypothetical protein
VRHTRKRPGSSAALGVAIAVLIVAPAGADEPRSASPVAHRVEIIAHVDGIAPAHRKWSLLAPLRISRDHGLSYRHSFVLGDRVVQFRLNGPVQRRKSLGLGFKIRF